MPVRAIVVAILLLASTSCKRSASDNASSTAPSKPSTAATPVGAVTTATIGPAGGKLGSSDGRLALSIPAGALSSDASVSIQAVAATEPNGVGPVYQISPDGYRFTQPVTLSWQLSDTDLKGRSLNAVIIVTRDADGHWISQPGVERDPATKTVRINTTHFSPWWAQLPDISIEPGYAQVQVRNTVTLTVSNADDDLLAAPAPAGAPAANANAASPSSSDNDLLAAPSYCNSWQVNGIDGGNAAFGRVTSNGGREATYSAPAKAPSSNPVAVTCTINKRINGVQTRQMAVAYIKVTDQPQPLNISLEYSYSRKDDNGEERRSANGKFLLQPDEYSFTGQGEAKAELLITGKSVNPVCTIGNRSKGNGTVQIMATGSKSVAALQVVFAGELSVEDGQQVSEGMKCKWRTETRKAPFHYSCNFTNVDFSRADTYYDAGAAEGTHCKIKVSQQ